MYWVFCLIDDLSFCVTESRVPGIGGRLVEKHVTVELLLSSSGGRRLLYILLTPYTAL